MSETGWLCMQHSSHKLIINIYNHAFTCIWNLHEVSTYFQVGSIKWRCELFQNMSQVSDFTLINQYGWGEFPFLFFYHTLCWNGAIYVPIINTWILLGLTSSKKHIEHFYRRSTLFCHQLHDKRHFTMITTAQVRVVMFPEAFKTECFNKLLTSRAVWYQRRCLQLTSNLCQRLSP